MRAVVQRVERARVSGDGIIPLGDVAGGFCILLGVARGDDEGKARALARKISRLCIFPDDEGRFARSLLDVGGEALVVSQFTLLAETTKGTRPSFSKAAPSEQAEPLYECFCKALREQGVNVATGRFGALMQVELVNDGPVTIVIDI